MHRTATPFLVLFFLLLPMKATASEVPPELTMPPQPSQHTDGTEVVTVALMAGLALRVFKAVAKEE